MSTPGTKLHGVLEVTSEFWFKSVCIQYVDVGAWMWVRGCAMRGSQG